MSAPVAAGPASASAPVPASSCGAALSAPAGADAATLRRLRWAVFLSGTIGYSLYYVCRLSLSVVKPALVREGELSETQLGLIGSGLFYAYAVGKLVNGFIADHANLNCFLSFGLLGTALVNLALGFGPGFYTFAALWLVSGWFQSMGSPACVVALSRWFAREERGTYYGLWSASHNIGEGLTFVAVAVLSSHFGWRWGFWGAAAAGLLGTALVALFFHNLPPPAATPTARPSTRAGNATAGAAPPAATGLRYRLAHQWAVLRHPVVWLIGASSAFMYIARYAINSWGIFFLELGKGYSRVEAGVLVSAGAVAGVCGTIASGWVSDHWFPHSRFLPALLAGLLNALSLAFILFVPAGHTVLDYAAMIGFGISIGALICYLGGLLAIDTVPKEAAGAALGLVGIASYVGAGTQDAISGWLIEQGKRGTGAAAVYDFRWVAAFWLGAALLSALITGWIWLRSRPAPPAVTAAPPATR